MMEVDAILVDGHATVRKLMEVIDQGRIGLALVVDDRRRLRATVTDGDVRRAILNGIALEDPVDALLAARPGAGAVNPTTLPEGSPASVARALMKERSIRHLPILAEDGTVVRVVLEDGGEDPRAPAAAVVMAGGLGTRLRPLTSETPKPMLTVGDRPLLEHIVEQLQAAGIRRVAIATHYKGERIREHFEDGARFGVDIQYLEEDRPLGTAGALGMFDADAGPVLVMNGDVLTRVNLAAMTRFHAEQRADLTLGVREFTVDVPYGVVDVAGATVTSLREKPRLSFLVNTGVYLLEPSVLKRIEPGKRTDMTDIIRALIADGGTVVSFPVVEYWLDVGRPVDYARAQDDYAKGELSR